MSTPPPCSPPRMFVCVCVCVGGGGGGDGIIKYKGLMTSWTIGVNGYIVINTLHFSHSGHRYL